MRPHCLAGTLCCCLLAIVLCGCQTPGERVEDQSAALNQALDTLFGRIDSAAESAVKTKALADKTQKGAADLNDNIPIDDPNKPEVEALARDADATADSAGETKDKTKLAAGTKPEVTGAADELSDTASTLAAKTQDTWLTWTARLAPLVLGIALALTIGLKNWKGTLAVLNILKPVIVPMLLGVAALGLVNLIVAMIPPWMWWTAGALAGLCVVCWLLYRLVPAVRAMSQAIKDSPNFRTLATQVKSAGAHIGPLLSGLGTNVTPKNP